MKEHKRVSTAAKGKVKKVMESAEHKKPEKKKDLNATVKR